MPEDPNVQTFVAKSTGPGKPVEFTVSGQGAIPRDAQATARPGSNRGHGRAGRGTCRARQPARRRHRQPHRTPDPLSKYKWWILGGLGLIMVAGAAFLLRKPAGAPAAAPVPEGAVKAQAAFVPPAAKNAALLNVLKEEMFTLESEKLSGTIAPEEYASVKAALETVLKRALKK